MQKAIYYVSRLIAARGVVELTDCRLNFQVSHFDSSFGMKSVSIDLATVEDLRILGGDMHPRVIVTSDRDYEFVLSKAQQLYDHLKKLCFSSVTAGRDHADDAQMKPCGCGRNVSLEYRYCPWCGVLVDHS